MGSMAEAPQSQFMGRLCTLPVVNYMWNYASSMYDKAKETSPVLKKTLDVAEITAKFAAGRALPVVTQFEKPLMLMDSLACQGLDQVEEKLPVITKSPQEIIETTKSYGTQKIGAVKSTVASVGSYGYTNAAWLLDNKYGLLALDGMNWTLAKADNYIDHYLPVGEDEKEGKEMPEENCENACMDGSAAPQDTVEAKINHSVTSVEKLASKMQSRLYSVVTKLTSLQLQSQDSFAVFTDTIKLVQSARSKLDAAGTTIMDKASYAWVELNKEVVVEEEGTEASLEVRAMNAARRFTHSMVALGASARDTVQAMPADLRLKVDAVLVLASKAYTDVWKALSMRGFISQEQLRQRFFELQEKLTAMVTHVITWMRKYTRDATPEKKTW